MSYKSNNERRRTKKLKPEPFRPIVGKRYHVRGYYTGDFTGPCVQVFKLTAVFQVAEKRVGAALDLGQLIEIVLPAVSAREPYSPSAEGAGVQISEAAF